MPAQRPAAPTEPANATASTTLARLRRGLRVAWAVVGDCSTCSPSSTQPTGCLSRVTAAVGGLRPAHPVGRPLRIATMTFDVRLRSVEPPETVKQYIEIYQRLKSPR